MHRFIIILLSAIIGMAMPLKAQKVKTVKGEAEYVMPATVSIAQAEATVIQMAMIDALAKEFGTTVSMETFSSMSSTNDGDRDDFWAQASSLVKGEWLETIGKPEITRSLDEQYQMRLHCKITGKAREIKQVLADVVVKVLRNKPFDDAESDHFNSGDMCMVSVKPAANGYLAIYLEDAAGRLYRMLPHIDEKDGSEPIEGGKRCVFFSDQDGTHDQYILSADGEVERNVIHVIYSTEKFVKPIDSAPTAEYGLRSLSGADFRAWISRARAIDNNLQVIRRPITIVNPTE